MSWLRVQIDLGNIPPDPVEQSLRDLGATSIHLSDGGSEVPDFSVDENHRGRIPDFSVDENHRGEPLWDHIRLDALLGEETVETSVLLTVASAVAPAPMPTVRFFIVEEQDWVARWTEALRPARFGEHLWICPPEIPCPDDRAICVTMEPGLGFGTGSHPTTALCLDWLARQPLREKALLDFGCGSGILAIAGLALGAGSVTAVDNDPQALTATERNARCNHCVERLRIGPANFLDPAETFEFIVANILSRTLIDLAPTIVGRARSGARIALSGILTSQAEQVSTASAQWVDFDPLENRREWAILYGTVT